MNKPALSNGSETLQESPKINEQLEVVLSVTNEAAAAYVAALSDPKRAEKARTKLDLPQSS